MRSYIALLLLLAIFHVAMTRPFDSFDDLVNQNTGRIIYKRSSPTQQELVMARLQELLGPEAFTEIDGHGRLSNLQRLG